ncbi:Wall-associated receptor kinase 2 [Camellia lanceoleosa]|uniref:Wall-associated receptor kinase 2 n=1 Tax=Camellia lanceoleosa TaxID=1840588 RepID=A0ACC0HI43_9ERIC|nr:Wall-associated receptor kinase 2 [Camellia lanceoleosa]
MYYNGPTTFLQLKLAWVLLGAAFASASASASAAVAQTLPGCEDRCGNISIPYPFGTTEGCYIQQHFKVACNDTDYHPPKLFLESSDTNVEITEILLSGELRISAPIGSDCFREGGVQYQDDIFETWITVPEFPISNTRNKFTAVGCDTYAVITGSLGRNYATGCLSLCDTIDSVINGSCSGIGCCQTSIPKGVKNYNITLSSYNNHTSVWGFNPCSYAFVAEETAYNFSSLDLKNLQGREKLPVVFDWAVGDQTCHKARQNPTSFACKDKNSNCTNFDNGPGYRCNCLEGYEGNPYIPNGCRDIDECTTSSPCNMTCQNLPGTYSCSCAVGYEGDGKKNGSGCSRIAVPNNKLPLITYIALGISIGISVLLLGGSWLYWGSKQRKIANLRETLFQQNGGIMLQELSKHEGSVQSAKIFTEEDLKKATNNFNENNVLGKGGQGIVYKGVLPDNTIVAIKKPRVADQSQSQIEQFINEVIILSQVNHRNVVKLLGCCLETKVPFLVYEFITNGTLYDHIHTACQRASSITWENRLRIAAETAAALSYLHSAASTPIIHRDVKTANILLDDNYVAKVSDFGSSRLTPIDQIQLATLVQGTHGYLDPESLQTSQLTEKSDVYSFGVVLVELLTGKEAISFDRCAAERNLAMYFILAMKEDRLFEIVDEQVKNEAKADQLKEFAILAKGCLRVKGEDRPTMKDVAMELEGMKMTEKHPWENDNKGSEETQYLLEDLLSDAYDGETSTRNSTIYDSITNPNISLCNGGR